MMMLFKSIPLNLRILNLSLFPYSFFLFWPILTVVPFIISLRFFFTVFFSSFSVLIRLLITMRSVHICSFLACVEFVFSQIDPSQENLWANEPDNNNSNNLFLDDNNSNGGGLFSPEPTIPDDDALLMHSTPLSDVSSNDNNLLPSNPLLLADTPDGITLPLPLPDDPTTLLANNACKEESLPFKWNRRLRARQQQQTSCPNTDAGGEGEGLGATKSMTDEEIKKHWCPETNAPFRGFGNIPVCSKKETDAAALPVVYYPFLENVELSKFFFFKIYQHITITHFRNAPQKFLWDR